jgi:hypothetical protein
MLMFDHPAIRADVHPGFPEDITDALCHADGSSCCFRFTKLVKNSSATVIERDARNLFNAALCIRWWILKRKISFVKLVKAVRIRRSDVDGTDPRRLEACSDASRLAWFDGPRSYSQSDPGGPASAFNRRVPGIPLMAGFGGYTSERNSMGCIMQLPSSLQIHLCRVVPALESANAATRRVLRPAHPHSGPLD